MQTSRSCGRCTELQVQQDRLLPSQARAATATQSRAGAAAQSQAGTGRTSCADFCLALDRAADRRLFRMRFARLGSMLGSRRGSSAGCRPPLPLRLWWGVRYTLCRDLMSAVAAAGAGRWVSAKAALLMLQLLCKHLVPCMRLRLAVHGQLGVRTG